MGQRLFEGTFMRTVICNIMSLLCLLLLHRCFTQKGRNRPNIPFLFSGNLILWLCGIKELLYFKCPIRCCNVWCLHSSIFVLIFLTCLMSFNAVIAFAFPFLVPYESEYCFFYLNWMWHRHLQLFLALQRHHHFHSQPFLPYPDLGQGKAKNHIYLLLRF